MPLLSAQTPQLTEAQLCQTWLRPGLLRSPLRSIDGRVIERIDPGRWNLGDGPDFLGAALKIDGALKRGDVEFHLNSGDWTIHRHHLDARYERVALHAALNHTGGGLYVRDSSLRPVPIVELRSQLTFPLGELPRMLESSPETRECPLPDGDPPTDARLSHIETMADIRLLRRVEKLEELANAYSLEEAFYQALGDALGYSENRAGFAKLTVRVPLRSLLGLPPLEIEARLLGAAGLIPPPETDERAALLRRLWTASRKNLPNPRMGAMSRQEWRFAPMRRGNAPTRRVAALAALAARHADRLGSMLDGMIKEAAQGDPGRGWRRRWEYFAAKCGGEGDPYWAEHDEIGRPSRRRSRRLVGESRARDIWINAALPALVLIAERRGDEQLRERAFQLYRKHPPLQSNYKTRWIAENALRQPVGSDKRMTARQQQGAIDLYSLFCRPRRCAECPLIGAESLAAVHVENQAQYVIERQV